jgi:uncharacterized protein (DUF2336 family)
LVLQLAGDIDRVSLPVLEHSPLLTDDDLIVIVRSGLVAKQMAIVRRASVSDAVAGVVVDSAGSNVVGAMVDNPGVCLSDATLQRIADNFGEVESVQRPLLRRHIPLSVAERLVNFTSETLKSYFATIEYVRPDIAQAIIRKQREEDTVRLPYQRPDEAVQLARQLAEGGRLTASLIIRALCVGNLALFEGAMATLAGIPVNNAYRLIHDAGGRGFEQLFRASKLPDRLLPAFRVALAVAEQTPWHYHDDPDRVQYSKTMVARIVTQFEEFDADDLDFLLYRLESQATA